MRILLFTVFIFSLSACSEKEKQNLSLFIEEPLVEEDSFRLVLNERHKDAIHDLIPVSGDTLLAAKWIGNVLRTFDGGKSWTELESPMIKHLAVDKNKRIWGISSWIGIHEADYAKILYSDDLGESWVEKILDPAFFFPYRFRSEYSDNIQILTANDKLYEYLGGPPNLVSSWKFIKQYYPYEYRMRFSAEDKTYRVQSDTILEKFNPRKNNWRAILNLNVEGKPYFRPIFHDLLIDSNKIYLAGEEDAGILLEIINEKKVKAYPVAIKQPLGVRKDSRGRIWIYGGDGIFKKEANQMIKMY